MPGPSLELTSAADDSKIWVNRVTVSRMYQRTTAGTSNPTVTVLVVPGAGDLLVKESPSSIATLLRRSGGAHVASSDGYRSGSAR